MPKTTILTTAIAILAISMGHLAHAQTQEPNQTSPTADPAPPVMGYAGPANNGNWNNGNWNNGYAGYPPAAAYNSPVPDQSSSSDQPDTFEAPFLDVAITTVFPLYIGGQVSVELPARITLAGDLGGMPSAYGSVINSAIQGFGGYDQSVGNLVDGSFDSALVARLSAGVRPFESAGFEIWGGYTYIDVSGETSIDEVSQSVDTADAPEVAAFRSQLGDEPVGLSSNIHAVHVALAWRWLVADHLMIRASVGYLQALGSSSSVEIDALPDAEPVINPAVDQTLAGLYSDYLKMPYGGLSVGYRF